MTDAEEFSYNLLHGIRLTVNEEYGVIDIHHLADFLAAAMHGFKAQRETLPAEALISEPLMIRVRDKSDAVIGTIMLAAPNSVGLPAASWAESIIDAYAKANTLEQMLDDLPSFRKAAKRDGGYLLTVASLLGRPTLHLHAYGELIKHTVKRH